MPPYIDTISGMFNANMMKIPGSKSSKPKDNKNSATLATTAVNKTNMQMQTSSRLVAENS